MQVLTQPPRTLPLPLPLPLTLTRCSSSSLRSPRPLESFELAPSSRARLRRDLTEIYCYSTGLMDGTGHQRVSLVTHAIRSPQSRTRTPVWFFILCVPKNTQAPTFATHSTLKIVLCTVTPGPAGPHPGRSAGRQWQTPPTLTINQNTNPHPITLTVTRA